MVLFCFIWFSALYFFVFKTSKDNDLLSPLKLVSVKYALLNLPFILFIYFRPQFFKKIILRACNVTLDEAFLQYTKVQTIAFVSLVLGIYAYNKWKILKPQSTVGTRITSYKSLKKAAIFFMAIGIGAYSVFIYRIGGFIYLFTHLDKRIQLQSSQYVLELLSFLYIGVLLFMQCVRLKNTKLNKIIFFVSLLISCFIFSSFGGRKNTFLLIIMVVISYHYTIKKTSFSTINKPLLAAVVVLLCGYILAVPVLRKKHQMAKLQVENANYGEFFNTTAFIYNTSYTFIDIFAANYFNRSNAWYLDGFFEPATALFAQPDKSMIPQVDQGVYFHSIVMKQKDFRPPLPRKELSKTSWPTENFGFAYANFLIPGVIVFFFLQGLVFAYAHSSLKNDIYNPILLLLYVLVIFTFNFSSLRIAAFIKMAPIIYFANILFNRYVRQKSIKDSFKINI